MFSNPIIKAVQRRGGRVAQSVLACATLLLLVAPPAGRLYAQDSEPQPKSRWPGAAVAVAASPWPMAMFSSVVEMPSSDAKAAIAGLETSLAQLYAAFEAGDETALAVFAEQHHINLERGDVTVILEMAHDPQAHVKSISLPENISLPDGRAAQVFHASPANLRPDLSQSIAAAGAVYQSAYQNWVQVQAPFASLPALAQAPGVRYVRLPFPAEQHKLRPAFDLSLPAGPTAGSKLSEGVSLMNANAWHSVSYNGTGVNLAIFDFGFTGWYTRQLEGNLPAGANLVLHDFSAAYDFGPPGTGGEGHGAACAEVAYDAAPDSTIHLYAFSSEVELGNAVSDYINNIAGNKVASMSVGWVNAGPYDGTGPINDIINTAQAAGVFWAQSAGNYQQQHYSWTSTRYVSTNYVQVGSNQYQEYGPADPNYWVLDSGVVNAYLAWNDWNAARNGNQSRQDYDVRLYRSRNGGPWTQVAYSLGNQCGDSNVPPTEALQYAVPAICADPNYCLFRLRIERYEGGGSCPNNFGHWMQLYTFNAAYQAGQGMANMFWDYNTCNSLAIPADGDSAVTVGATFWSDDADSARNYGLETFSSFGPRNGSGGAAPGATVNKPDFAAPDGVTTATYGDSDGRRYADGGLGFWGSSPAAAHVAGLAASAWEKEAAYTAAQLRGRLQSEAVYKGDGGACGRSLSQPESAILNNRFGWGRSWLGSPTAVELARFEAALDGAAIRVEWETAIELDNVGFNLYRGQAPDGTYDQLNKQLISAQNPGGVSGAAYTWVDASVEPGVTYYYKLEDVDIYGLNTWHGPVEAGVPAGILYRVFLPCLTR